MSEVLTKTDPYQGTEASSDLQTQGLLNEWFHDREINQDEDHIDKWLRQFRRNLNHVYDHYLLLAELELAKLPNLSEYEHAIHEELRGSTSGTNAKTGSDTHGGALSTQFTHGGTETLTRTGTEQDQGTDSNTRTFNDTVNKTKTGTEEQGYNSGESLTRTGTETDQGTSGNTRTFNDTETVSKSGNDTLTHNTTLSKSKTGTESLQRGGTQTTQNTGTQINSQTTDASHKEVQLVAPQSASYPNGNGGAGAGNMPPLDWTYVSQQAQSSDNAGATTRTDNLSQSVSDNRSDTTTFNVSAPEQKTGTETQGYNSEVETKHTGTVSDQGTSGNTKTLNTTDALTKTGKDTTTYNTTDGEAHTGTVGDSGTSSNTKTLNTTDTKTKGGQDTEVTNDTRSITYGSTETKSQSKNDHLDRMETGRNVVETEIRKQIWKYIENSMALEWLIKEMDICFLGVF